MKSKILALASMALALLGMSACTTVPQSQKIVSASTTGINLDQIPKPAFRTGESKILTVRSTNYYPKEGYYQKIYKKNKKGQYVRTKKGNRICIGRRWVNTNDSGTDAGRSRWGVDQQYADHHQIGTCASNPAEGIKPGSLVEVIDDGVVKRFLSVDTGAFEKWKSARKKFARAVGKPWVASIPTVDFFSKTQVGGYVTQVRVTPFPGGDWAALKPSQRAMYLSPEAWGIKNITFRNTRMLASL